MRVIKHGLLLFVILCSLYMSCDEDPMEMHDVGDLSHIDYTPTPYEIPVPYGFPTMVIPEDNPMTEEGRELGRHLFYDPILSRDSTISCASCHLIEKSFTDARALAIGIEGRVGRRSSMSLLNVGYHYTGLFWDGRSPTLEAQAIHPIQDPVEMDEDWSQVEIKLQQHSIYPSMFREAFGIENKKDITRQLVAKALAQFQRSIVSSGNSDYDKFIVDLGATFNLEEEALLGYRMFFDVGGRDASCGHCHNGHLFSTNEYLNNGITPYTSLQDFSDLGLGMISRDSFDNGKFKVPTLRNISLTAPYMHDGRFASLKEVLDHYDSGGHRPLNANIDNVDLDVVKLGLSEEEKEQIIAFLETLVDTSVIKNKKFQSPF